jgi:hypothetical protein
MTASKKNKQFSAVSIPMPVSIATASGGKKMLTVMIKMRYGMLRIVAKTLCCVGMMWCKIIRASIAVSAPDAVPLSSLRYPDVLVSKSFCLFYSDSLMPQVETGLQLSRGCRLFFRRKN